MHSTSLSQRARRSGALVILTFIALLLLARSGALAAPYEPRGHSSLFLPFVRGGTGAAATATATPPANPPATMTPSRTPSPTQPGSTPVNTVTRTPTATQPAQTPVATISATHTATATSVPGPGNDDATFFLDDTGEPASLYNASIAVDGAGQVHATFHDFSSDDENHQIYYARCASTCVEADDFTVVPVGSSNGGTYYTSLNIAVDSSGRPRLLWGTDEGFEYAQCNAACTNPANWTQTTVATISNYEYGHSSRFALDSQNRPRFIYRDEFGAPDSSHEGTWFAYCNSGCTSEANWHETKLTGEEWEIPSLDFDGAGRPRFTILGDYLDGIGLRQVGYLECATATCAEWNGVYFSGIFSDGTVELELDSAGRPRIALHSGDGWETVEGIEPDQLYYYSCNSNCADESGTWNEIALFEPGAGGSVDLELDSQDRPALSMERSNVDYEALGVIFARCTANCESGAPTWQVHDIDLTAELNGSYPVPPPDNCAISVWSLTDQSDLALDPTTGDPRVIHTAEHRLMCSGSIYTVNAGIRYRSLDLP